MRQNFVPDPISMEETERVLSLMRARTHSEGEELFLDYLSTGQWVDTKKYGPQWRRLKCASDADVDGTEFLHGLVEDGILLSIPRENGRMSTRMTASAVIAWRTRRNLTLSPVDQTCPRFFGGVLEDDIWVTSPLRTVSMVTLTCSPSSTSEEIRRIALPYGGLVLDDGGGGDIIRIMCASSRPLISTIKSMNATKTVRNTEVRRRETVDIDDAVLADLVGFYLVFTKSIIKGRLSTILSSISRDDIESQLFTWIIDAIRRFDGEAGTPFGAYLAERVKMWAHDLKRVGMDSATATQQTLAQKAKSIEGTVADKAQALGVSESKLEAAMGTSRRVFSMGKGAVRLDADTDELSSLHDRVSAPHDDTELERISTIHRGIVEAALKCAHPDDALLNVLNSLLWDEGESVDENGKELLGIMRGNEKLRRFVTC